MAKFVRIIVMTNVIEAPQWLRDRMEVLRKLPPPTLEQVRTQFRASARCRRKYIKEEMERESAYRIKRICGTRS
jgi:hypothetical protein